MLVVYKPIRQEVRLVQVTRRMRVICNLKDLFCPRVANQGVIRGDVCVDRSLGLLSPHLPVCFALLLLDAVQLPLVALQRTLVFPEFVVLLLEVVIHLRIGMRSQCCT